MIRQSARSLNSAVAAEYEQLSNRYSLAQILVLEAFQRHDNADKTLEIVNFLNDKGFRNILGGKMTHSSVNTMLKNRRYIGELSFRDIVVPDAIPAIVPKDLFDRVQKRMVPCDLIIYIA